MFISFVMLYIGGAKLKHIFGTAFIVLDCRCCCCNVFYSFTEKEYLTFINAINNGGTANIQVKQALLGLGSGGIFGVGIGHSMQSNLFLPESYGDFIFAIVGEELGFIGSVIVLFSYLVLFIAGIIIAKKTKDNLDSFLLLELPFQLFFMRLLTQQLLPDLFQQRDCRCRL